MKYYDEFKSKIEEISKQEEYYCRNLCINTWIKILNELNIPYKIQLGGYCISIENNINIGLCLTDNTKWTISYYNYRIDDSMFPYGELFDKYSVEKQLMNMIKISKTIEI